MPASPCKNYYMIGFVSDIPSNFSMGPTYPWYFPYCKISNGMFQEQGLCLTFITLYVLQLGH